MRWYVPMSSSVTPFPIFATHHDDDTSYQAQKTTANLEPNKSTSSTMKTTLSNTGIAAIRLLEALDASADVFPPLKSAVGGALHIAKLVRARWLSSNNCTATQHTYSGLSL